MAQPDPTAGVQIMLAEYAALRAETERRGWFSVTGWNLVHPTRLAFEGVGLLALFSAAFVGGIRLWVATPPWPVIVAFAVGWLIGLAITTMLHTAFERASDL